MGDSPLDRNFRKSSFSYPAMGCVMTAKKNGVIVVRDSKDPKKTTLTFTENEWDAFIKGVKSGEFDL